MAASARLTHRTASKMSPIVAVRIVGCRVMLTNQFAKRGPGQAEPARGHEAVAVELPQDLVDGRRFHHFDQLLIQISGLLRSSQPDLLADPLRDDRSQSVGDGTRRGGIGRGGEMLWAERAASRLDGCMLQGIPQLADITRPRPRLQEPNRLGRQDG